MTDAMGFHPHLGDWAERVATDFVTETSVPVAEAAAIAEEEAFKKENNIFAKIRFSWRPEDRAALDRIRASADLMFSEVFEAAIQVIDHFYEQIRVPEQRNGITLLGADRRPVWERDELGNPKEDWTQLTGQDIEYTLACLERVKLSIVPRVNELMLEAIYARHVASDIHDDSWAGIMDGTQSDKSATANRKSRQDRYHAFFRFYLYSVADTFLKELNGFAKLLENVRWWQVRSYKG